MISRFTRCVLPVTAAVSMAALVGCAGSKSSSSSSGETAIAEPPRNQKLDDARRSAEEAELKAHEMRVEKNRNTAKNGN
jgi:hypothetical protein